MSVKKEKVALIIGAGPAGLTAALELLRNTDIRPIILEASDAVGGISRTVNFQGYGMDLGGHRFFSKSDWVMDWWLQILPLEMSDEMARQHITLRYRNEQRDLAGIRAPEAPRDKTLKVMLVRNRLSRIYFLRKLYDYPIKLNLRSIRNLGPLRCLRVGASYAWLSIFPRRPERNLEDFLINRFGNQLYRMFFRSYTEKVWGVPCSAISAEWGGQRIKGLSLASALVHALLRWVPQRSKAPRQGTPTSLVERFLYPRRGPGQLWETVADLVRQLGGEIRLSHSVDRIDVSDGMVTGVGAHAMVTGEKMFVAADWVISTMAVKDMIESVRPPVPDEVARIANELPYRNFITVGMIVRRMKMLRGQARGGGPYMLPDNWIYIQEPEVKLGRLQIFNNWSPALVPDPDTVSLGLEYFCNDNDELWRMSDADMQALAIRELVQIDLIDQQDVIATTVIRVPKAYPAYFGSYSDFGTVREYVDGITNLFLIGRNGMHRYNNQDHSMLTAKAAVDNIMSGVLTKDNIWGVNIGDDYQESKVP